MQASSPIGEGVSLPASRRPPFPAPLTACIGREAELAQLGQLLADPGCRLLTVCGGGGIGKTHLVLEWGRRTLEQGADRTFAHDGIAFVSLASLSARLSFDDWLATTIAEGLGFTLGGPEPPDVQLRRYLRDRSLLLILDNLEQIPQAAPFLATLLQAAPGLNILATSRERLRLRGEHVLVLEPLAYPSRPDSLDAADEQYSAVQLFLAAARSSTPGLVLDARTRADVVRICRLVEGLPLGIELAASWTRVLSCAEIAQQLERNLDELDGTLVDMPARHQSLRAVFDSSWYLLSTAEQQVLRRLGILRGAFERNAAAVVADASVALLLSLVDKSLLRRLPDDGMAGARFEMPGTLRQFALEQLEDAGETEATSARYATWFLERLAQDAPRLRGAEQQATLTAIGADIEHMRAAWRWAVDRADHAALRRAADSLLLFYYMRSWFSEGAAMFGAAREAVEHARGEPGVTPAWSTLLAREAWFIFQLGRQREAAALLEQSAAALRPLDAPGELVFTLNYLAAVYGFLGEYGRTEQLCRESLALTEAIDDRYSRAVACNILGQAAYDQAQYERARSWSEQSLQLELELGNRWSQAFSQTNLGKVAYAQRDFASARQFFEQSLRIRQEMGDVRGVAISLARLGEVAAAQDTPGEAADLFVQSLASWRETANPWGIAASLLNLGLLALAGGRDPAAARILADASRLARETQALPQLLDIAAALARLLRRSGDSAQAAALQGIVDASPGEHAAQQLSRLLEQAEHNTLFRTSSTLSLEHAVDEVRSSARAMPPAQTAAGSSAATLYPAGLTAREVDVLRLVAQGLTDKQVAERLIVSPRTVTSHLTSIYGKLEVNTRAAATRFAVDHGLV